MGAFKYPLPPLLRKKIGGTTDFFDLLAKCKQKSTEQAIPEEYYL